MPFDHCEEHLSNFKNHVICLRGQYCSYDVVVKFSQNQYRLGRGWRYFVVANNLEKDDACLFQLIKWSCDPLIYDVKIFKA